MQRYSDRLYSAAYRLKWRADNLAGVDSKQPRPLAGWLSVPPHWTAWLLMEKAGLPRDLIADVCRVSEAEVTRALRIATALMIFPPHAARVERLAGELIREAGQLLLPTPVRAGEEAWSV